MKFTSKYKYELADFGQAYAIKDLFDRVTSHLLSHGIDQWDGKYPSMGDIEMDIQKKNCYINIDDGGGIRATMALNDVQDDQYRNVDWKYTHGRIAVLHRVVVDPTSQGQGLGKDLCQFAEQLAIDNKFSSIRLDTYSRNQASNGLYKTLGYERANGLCFFHGNKHPFYCYEKAFSL